MVDTDENTVVAVHCLGGKGRTGVFVSAWLMYSTFASNAQTVSDPRRCARGGLLLCVSCLALLCKSQGFAELLHRL
jgi:protein-tyrosine phosphatase